ncbi:MAG: GNAT family N-acetyltransferase [Lysobacterales bacterium]
MRWRSEVRERDAAAVRRLVADTAFFNAEEVDIAVELVEETLQRGEAAGYAFVFADDDTSEAEELLAYTCYGPIPATRSSYDLYWIAVTPSSQGQGLGAAILRESERRARAAGATQMYVDTSGRDQYQPTRAFYERMGYERAAVLCDFFAPGDDKVVYVRRLSESA